MGSYIRILSGLRLSTCFGYARGHSISRRGAAYGGDDAVAAGDACEDHCPVRVPPLGAKPALKHLDADKVTDEERVGEIDGVLKPKKRPMTLRKGITELRAVSAVVGAKLAMASEDRASN